MLMEQKICFILNQGKMLLDFNVTEIQSSAVSQWDFWVGN